MGRLVLTVVAVCLSSAVTRAQDLAEAFSSSTQSLAEYRAKARAERPLREAGLDPDELAKAGWNSEALQQLGGAIERASAAVREMHSRFPDAVADAYHNGTMTNLDQSLFAAYRAITKDDVGKRADYKRGCVSHQETTLRAVRGLPTPALEVKPLMVGSTVLEHHAVIVFPKGSDWQNTGVVLDGWIHQQYESSQMTFTISAWKRRLALIRLISDARLE